MDIPKHVAIVMDGNGRWAKRRGRPRIFGHVRGSARVRSVVKEASRLGIQALTLYAFSTENWNRPESERKVLWKLLRKYLLRDIDELHRQNVKLRVIGQVDRLDHDVREVLTMATERLAHNTGLQLNFALSYGSRSELTDAARRFAVDCLAGRATPDSLNENVLDSYLWTGELGELSKVDLFIRTSGEQRVSNFLLWQAAYAEFVFLEVCWPEFEPKHLEAAVNEFSLRERRFGGLGKVTHV